MKILVHDFAGHPFQVELSRTLARRGHEVTHAYCASLVTTPRGALSPSRRDPVSFTIQPVELDEPLAKMDFLKRWRQENEYGRRVGKLIRKSEPDVVLSGNTPLDAQRRMLRLSSSLDIPFVFWAQDLIGLAAERLLRGRWLGLGRLIGRYYRRMERQLLLRSTKTIVISDDFKPLLLRYGIREHDLVTIENWAPLEEIAVEPRSNSWAQEHGVSEEPTLLYSGTLGMKHNPELLRRLARDLPGAEVVVVSQGSGADWLRERSTHDDLPNLHVLDFQPYERLPEVLGSADILVAILEPEADVFSVPSKVLTYLCARRPLLLAVPSGNLAARVVERIEAGFVVSPDDAEAFVARASKLLKDEELRESMATNARAYAERAFDIDDITDRFERTLEDAISAS